MYFVCKLLFSSRKGGIFHTFLQGTKKLTKVSFSQTSCTGSFCHIWIMVVLYGFGMIPFLRDRKEEKKQSVNLNKTMLGYILFILINCITKTHLLSIYLEKFFHNDQIWNLKKIIVKIFYGGNIYLNPLSQIVAKTRKIEWQYWKRLVYDQKKKNK